jgi:hypothetical protein
MINPNENKPRSIEITGDETPIEPTREQLDADEAALRALRIDLPGTAGAPTGIVSIAVSDKFPRREFFRTHPTNIWEMAMVDHVSGMDVEHHAVMPAMVPELGSIGVDALPYRVYELLTAEGALRLMPVRLADIDGSLNEWSRTKQIVCARGARAWVRAVTDRANGRYGVFEAQEGRFPDPVFPDYGMGKLVRLAFTDRGRLIADAQHPLFLKWAARDA